MSKAMSLKAKSEILPSRKTSRFCWRLHNYMFERLFVRLSASSYKKKWGLKDGMLATVIVSLDNRAMMELNATLQNLPLTPKVIHTALEQICTVPSNDGVTFETGMLSFIRENDIYGGYRVALIAKLETMPISLSIDTITPHAVRNSFTQVFGDEQSYEL